MGTYFSYFEDRIFQLGGRIDAFDGVQLLLIQYLLVVQHFDEDQIGNLLEVCQRVRHAGVPHELPQIVDFRLKRIIHL